MRLSRRILAILTALSLLPLFGVLLTALIAGTFGCEVNEGGATPCVVLGADIGGFLSGMLTLGWFALLTIPFLMLLVGLWALVEAYWWGRTRRKLRRAERESRA
jgi:hypothetical protein